MTNENKLASMDAVGELWSDVPDYEGLYQASTLGRVRSLERRVPAFNAVSKKMVMKFVPARMMSLKKYGKGYLGVTLHKQGTEIKYYVQRVILTTFKGKKPDGMVACHNNGNKKDNRLENLRWDTPKNNEADKLNHGTRYFGEKHHNSKFTNEQVLWIRSGVTYEQVKEKIDISKRQYENIVKRIAWPHLPSSQSDAWNDASILPTECKVYETKVGKDFISAFQFYDGEKWCFACGSKDHAAQKKYWPETELTTRQWREVQP